MLGGPYDLNPFLSSKKPGYGEHPNKCYRKPTDQHYAPGGVPGAQDKKSRTITIAQIRGRKEEKIKVSTGHRGLFTDPSLPVAGFSAFHQATQLTKLFWFHRQQARYLKLFFFFREQPRPPKGKTRWGRQCHRGTQKPDGNTLSEPLIAPLALSTSHVLLPLRATRLSAAFSPYFHTDQGVILSRSPSDADTCVGPYTHIVVSRQLTVHCSHMTPLLGRSPRNLS
ncbi:uncharacterized protein LOC143805894 isoform X2 [Ranitomeya variabilis]|uniref:uncharacterized protein LOC143805894 isoform X2 n=1 Tax=Ranitomeya variabilis TaxID=490064 RepID=UPI0040560B7F